MQLEEVLINDRLRLKFHITIIYNFAVIDT